ncbi:hypothetical protein Tco_0671307 [Tanacetum coccineum]
MLVLSAAEFQTVCALKIGQNAQYDPAASSKSVAQPLLGPNEIFTWRSTFSMFIDVEAAFYSRTGNPWSRITTVLLIVNELIRTQLAKLQQCKLNVHFSTYFTRMTQRQRDRQTNYTSSESVSVSDEDSDPEQGSEGQGNAKESWVTPLQMKPVRVKVLKIMRIQGKDDDVQTSEKGVPLQADWLEDTGMKIDQEQRNWMHITATWEKDSDVLTEESGSIGQHWNRFAPEREETMTLENESRSKLNKDKVKPYDYTNQNSLYEIFKGPSLEYLYQLDRRNNEVRKTIQNDSFRFEHELKMEMHEDFEYVKSLEKEVDELESEKADFSNMYDLLLEECVSKDVICSYLHSLSELNAHTELQCMYLHKVKECEFCTKLSKQTESV